MDRRLCGFRHSASPAAAAAAKPFRRGLNPQAGRPRRGYSFTDGIDPQAGTLLGGLFFIAFMKSPAQFMQLQRSLAGDALNEYIHHTGSAVFACPPGLRPGQHWGDTLFS